MGNCPPLSIGLKICWSRLITEDDRQAGTDAMGGTGPAEKSTYIYLELLYVRWYDRFSRMGIYGDRGSAEDQQMLEELRHLPNSLSCTRSRCSDFFDLVLDVTAQGVIPQQQAAMNYLYDSPKVRSYFASAPFRSVFEPVEAGPVFAGFLYSASILDMIDYSLRSWCGREALRCGAARTAARYFPQTGRVSAEYCERPVAEGQQTCRENRSFPAVDKEAVLTIQYSRHTARSIRNRFARIKARRISDTDFYAWSEPGQRNEKEMRLRRHHSGGI